MIMVTLAFSLLLIGIIFIASARRLLVHCRKMPGSGYRMHSNHALYLILLLLAISAFIFFFLLLLA